LALKNMRGSDAHITKVSRRTIMRAIETQELQAFRDNRNRCKIDPTDLDKWAGAQLSPTGHTNPDMPTLPTSETLEIERLKGQLETERQLRHAAEVDRDHWRGMAQKLADQPRSWWPWRRKGRT
jgi:hypothetical protein